MDGKATTAVPGRDGEVVGRTRELTEVGELLGAPPEGGMRVLVVTGPPGSGKSTLVRAALQRAADLAMPVLLACPREPEQPLAFSVLADLLEDGLDPDTAGLPPPQRAALRHALGLDVPPPGAETDPRLVAAALRALLTSAATARRVLLVLDDAHWADASSLLVLTHALHRARGAGISVLVATRPQLAADPWPSGDGRSDIALGPLTEAAVFQLVRTRLGRTLGRGDLRRIVAVSGGNPMYALELAGLDGFGAGTLSPTLEALVAGSVRELSAPTRRLLLAAALAHDPQVELVGRASTHRGTTPGKGEPPDGATLDAAVAAAVSVARVENGRLRFRHPLHAAAVVADAAPEELRATHARLAALETGDEVSARHLALAAEAPVPETRPAPP